MDNNISIKYKGYSIDVDLRDHNLGAFLGAFVSEGNLTEPNSIKISSKNLIFLDSVTSFIRNIFGDYGATYLPPTPEDKKGEKGYHKYFSSLVAKTLVSGYGVRPGRKVINNQGLPKMIMNEIGKNPKQSWLKKWIIAYIQNRFSGDAHIRDSRHISKKGKEIITRRIVLTRNNSLNNIDDSLFSQIDKHFEKGKSVIDYPGEIVEILNNKYKEEINYPKELVDLEYLLKAIFDINCKIYPSWVHKIYHDDKRNIYLITGVYRLVISRREDIITFQRKINFAESDMKNRQKLINLIKSYKIRAG